MENLSEETTRDNDEVMLKTYSKEEIDQTAEIGIQALRAAKVVHDQLGEDGLTLIQSPNQFREQVLKGDMETEEAVLKSLEESGLPIRVVSEEHETTDLSTKPELLGILDGIDGSSQYREGVGKLRYGTMLGIAAGVKPRYNDYLFSGIMEHSTNRLWIGIKDQGSFLVNPDGNRIQIHTSSKTVFDDSTQIYSMSPEYNDTARKYLTELVRKFKTQLPFSEAIALADIASGETDLAVEATRKGNIEQMIAFGLITEAGGIMVDKDNKSIGNQRFLKWGQKESVLLVTASTPELATNFLGKIKGI